MSSPLQNRVLPTGEIVAIPERGCFMGNRGGKLHDPGGRLGRARWKSRQWIICLCDFKGRHRQVMGEGYTELFFLDEVTALAAGHRPCFECRRQDAVAFAHAFPGDGRCRAGDMDAVLHSQRRGPAQLLPAADLPEGAMFTDAGRFWARSGTLALEWAAGGYARARPLPDHQVARLTPQATASALQAGYRPQWHPSAASVSAP